MAHKVETMAYANQTPWHGLGFKVGDDLSPEEMMKAAKIDWTVSKRKLYVPNRDGSLMDEVPSHFAIVRDTDERVLTTVGKMWTPTQNAQAVDFFTKFVKAGHMSMETMGSLSGGQFIWALASLKQTFALKGPKQRGASDDEISNYLLLMLPHLFGYSQLYQYTAIRVVCWNTLNMALGSSLDGKTKSGAGFRMPHYYEFDDRMIQKAEAALGLSLKRLDEFKEAAELLARTRASSDDVEQFFFNVIKFDPEKAKEKAKEEKKEFKEPRVLEKFRAALTHAPGALLPSAAGTWWGAFNATTQVVDHESGRERDTALRSAWVGEGAGKKRRALKLAIEAAKAA